MAKTKPYPPEVMDRGKFGWAVAWPHDELNTFVSAMPDEKTARRAAASEELYTALDAIHRDCLEVASGRERASAEFWLAVINRAHRALLKADGTT